jgi:3-oxoacyl-[acyl-carrier protein] reductase
MDLQLKNMKALITGASRGLGFATARGLAQEGAALAVNSRDPEHITAAAGKLALEGAAEVHAFPGNVSQPGVPGELVRKAAAALGGLDILITNAGGPPSGSFESFDEEDWSYGVNLSFLSHVRLIRAALPFLRQSVMPSVLTITSISVKQPITDLVLSNSIRAATAGLTKTLAIELGGEGIRFNSILPGSTDTERITELMSDRAAKNGTTVEEELAKQAANIPLGRLGSPQEFANTAVFLVSPAASYLNGVMLQVDGGAYKGLF